MNTFMRTRLMNFKPYRVYREVWNSLERNEILSRASFAFARAAATAAVRVIDPLNPESWEFSGFSQHGEDGIIEYLISQMTPQSRNGFFFEIGAADGLQNCTAWLAYAKNYGGVMVEGNEHISGRSRTGLQAWSSAVHHVTKMVDQDNVVGLFKMCPYRDLDVFSLDIDGIDYYVGKKVLELGFRPKIIVAEYNSAFGPDQALTVPYDPRFNRWHCHSSGLCYGVSITGWRRLFESYNYDFVTTEKSGTNAFFLDPAVFPSGFTKDLARVDFRENSGDLNAATTPHADPAGDSVLPIRDWRIQFEMIKNTELVRI
jgi:hypothetical protein